MKHVGDCDDKSNVFQDSLFLYIKIYHHLLKWELFRSMVFCTIPPGNKWNLVLLPRWSPHYVCVFSWVNDPTFKTTNSDPPYHGGARDVVTAITTPQIATSIYMIFMSRLLIYYDTCYLVWNMVLQIDQYYEYNSSNIFLISFFKWLKYMPWDFAKGQLWFYAT